MPTKSASAENRGEYGEFSALPSKKPAASTLILLAVATLTACALPVSLQRPFEERPSAPEFTTVEGHEDGLTLKVSVPDQMLDGTPFEPRGTLDIYRATVTEGQPARYESLFSIQSSDSRVTAIFDRGEVTLRDVKMDQGAHYQYLARFTTEGGVTSKFSQIRRFQWHGPPGPPERVRLLAEGPAVRIHFEPQPQTVVEVFRRDVGPDQKPEPIFVCRTDPPCVDLSVKGGGIYAYSFRTIRQTDLGPITGSISREWYVEVPSLADPTPYKKWNP